MITLRNLKINSLTSFSASGFNGEQQLECGSIVFDNVSKRFRKQTLVKQSYTTVKTDLIHRLFSFKRAQPSFTEVLNGVSFKLPAGKSLGVIGRNGSGKSTLLKLISGIYRPDSGRIAVNGKISALIELGAGFHPDFTGRENIFLGGIMYGLSRREIEERFEKIVAYAQLEDFIDDPVRTYSSGMYMRLGFSLAVHTSPDILLIDEVLAVGDASFIARCQETISDFRRQGKTFVFVTHDLTAVTRWCDEVVWLHRGRVRQRGEPRRVVDYYLSNIEEGAEEELDQANRKSLSTGANFEQLVFESAKMPESVEEKRWGSGDVELIGVRMLDEQSNSRWLFQDDESVTIEVDYEIKKPVKELVFGVGLIRADGLEVFGANTAMERINVPLPVLDSKNLPVRGSYRCKISRLSLAEGSYYLDLAAHREDGFPYDYHHRLHKFSVRNRVRCSGVLALEYSWEVC